MLSIIIVNYKVKHFLEQCLFSVEKALRGYAGEGEVWVVDNASGDGSLEYLVPRFPHVHFIQNSENTGFGRANNLGLEKARGEYILFLNPDTILAEDTLDKMIAGLEQDPLSGAAGVCMIDGSGRFLKESRRGFPSPWASLCKLTGLTALFPNSRRLAGYYLGGTDATRRGPAPILSGACMMVKKQALDKTGGFDERFFMYAEDIDLSHRIGLAGYTNYYLAETAILHFKGESTRKDSRYTRQFYKAMSQFMHKYYRGAFAGGFTLLMDAAIVARAFLAALAGFFRPSRNTLSGKPTAGSGGLPRVYITGDPQAAEKCRELLAGRSILLEEPSDAGTLLFCEGELFSFKEIIRALRENPGKAYGIHAAGSGSIVLSHSKEEPGEIITL